MRSFLGPWRYSFSVLSLSYDQGLIRVTATGRIQVSEMETHFAELEQLARDTSGPVAAVIDARGVVLSEMRGAHRDCAVAALKRMRPLIEDRYKAQAFVLESVWGRAMVAMLHLFVKPAEKTKSFASVAPAERWATKMLRGA